MFSYRVRSALLIAAVVVAFGVVATLSPGTTGGGNGTAELPGERSPPPQQTGGGAWFDWLDATVSGVLLPDIEYSAVLTAILAALVCAAGLLWVSSGPELSRGGAAVDGEDVEADEGDEAALEAVGRAAGAAADRLRGDGEVTNEVARAWAEMTRHLDVRDPETTTPAEFADAAVAAGMDPDDVAELTRLFEDVRYGGADPSVRADRAVAALRRVEREYEDRGGPNESRGGRDEPGGDRDGSDDSRAGPSEEGE